MRFRGDPKPPLRPLSALVAVDREGGGEVRHFGLDAFEDGLVSRRLEQIDDQVRHLAGLGFAEAAGLMAGEPRRMPDVTKGFSGSFGMAFLLTVM